MVSLHFKHADMLTLVNHLNTPHQIFHSGTRITLFPEVSHIGGFAQIECFFDELSEGGDIELDHISIEAGMTEDRVVSRVIGNVVIFSIIPVFFSDDGTQARCVLIQPNGTRLFSESVTLRVDATTPPTGI